MTSVHMTSRLNAVPLLGGPPTDKKYRFPIETDDVLIDTLNKIGIHDVFEHDLQRPTQQVALTCFSAFAELLSFVNDEVVETIKIDCLNQLDHKEIYDESLHFLIRFIELRALMIASCIPDFSIPDITRPKPKRFRKQMFALVNFLRFSEYQIQHFDKVKEEKDGIFNEKQALAEKVEKTRMQVQQIEDRRKEEEERTMQLEEENSRLRRREKQLEEESRSLQAQLKDSEEQEREEKIRRDGLRKESASLEMEVRNLKIRIDEDPAQIRKTIENRRTTLLETQESESQEKAKAQMLASKDRVLDGLEKDIAHCAHLAANCLKVQNELAREIEKLDEIRQDRIKVTGERDQLAIELEQKKAELKSAIDRLERARETYKMRQRESKRKAEETNERWQQAQQEKKMRNEKAEEVNRQVSDIEAEYDRITRDFDAFYAALSQQKRKLEKQTRGYMQAIAERMDLQVDVL